MSETEERTVPREEILALYDAVGWTTYTRDPDALFVALEETDLVVLAWEGDVLVGLARVLSDDVHVAYVQDILVHPDHQRKGIGQDLMDRVLERYKHVRQTVLLCDATPELDAFYKSVGFGESSTLGSGLAAYARIKGVNAS